MFCLHIALHLFADPLQEEIQNITKMEEEQEQDMQMEGRDSNLVYVNSDTLQQRVRGVPGRRFTTSGASRLPRLGAGYLVDNQMDGTVGGFNFQTSRGQYGGGRSSFGAGRGSEYEDELVSENARLATENRMLLVELSRISHEINK